MTQLREKAFKFKLIQEYLQTFMEVFREENPDAYEQADQKIQATRACSGSWSNRKS